MSSQLVYPHIMKNARRERGKHKTWLCGTHLAHDLRLTALLAVNWVILGGGFLSSKISIWTHYRLWLRLRPPPKQKPKPLGTKAVKELRQEEMSEWCYAAQTFKMQTTVQMIRNLSTHRVSCWWVSSRCFSLRLHEKQDCTHIKNECSHDTVPPTSTQ